MAFGRTETWFWRIIGICALAVCSLNVMVLMRGPQQTFSESILLERLQRQGTGSQEAIGQPPKNTEDTKKAVVQGTTISAAKSVKQIIPHVPSLSKGAKALPGEIAESVKRLPVLDVSRVSVHLKAEQIMLAGKRRTDKAFLVIGVPTVKRSKAYYLLDTVQGLVNGLSKEEHSEVVIVVFVADFDVDYRSKVKTEIQNRFPSEVESGLIQVIVAPIGFYPKMDKLPLLYGDSVPRVQWRSKQSLDYSFLYFHCADLGRYFLQLEDDVLTEDKYFPKIKKFISSRVSPWSTLEFGSRGFIGMMYDASHLKSLAKFCRMYFFLMPVDWLFRVFNDVWLYGNEKTNIHKPSLFKHIGTFSSLDGQVRKLEDIQKGGNALVIVNNPRTHKDANNPPAHVETTIAEFVPKYPISEAYAKGSFWGKKIVVGDIVMVSFITPVKLKRFVVISGHPTYPADSLENGEVFISGAPKGVCDAFHSIFKYIDKSTVDTGEIKVDYPVKCIKLVLDSVRLDDHQRPRWLVIREISVWTR